MKKLLLLVFSCFCFLFASAQTNSMNAYFYTGSWSGTAYHNADSPMAYLPLGTERLNLIAPTVDNVVKHEWFFNGLRQTADSRELSVSTSGYSHGYGGYFTIRYQATDNKGKIHTGLYYFRVGSR